MKTNKLIPAQRHWGHSLTACNAVAPAKSKIATRGPKLAEGVWKGVAHGFGLNKFFDLSTLSMKNQMVVKKRRKKKEKIDKKSGQYLNGKFHFFYYPFPNRCVRVFFAFSWFKHFQPFWEIKQCLAFLFFGIFSIFGILRSLSIFNGQERVHSTGKVLLVCTKIFCLKEFSVQKL